MESILVSSSASFQLRQDQLLNLCAIMVYVSRHCMARGSPGLVTSGLECRVMEEL
ncbi:hypothetical protein VFPPC_15953 [Pochonia chlamydosporia 170]|uniref:Uncharacterized protein n=1 Tax=Pochonia chlamydosporia 170 TaxID=1380566 RepID=A0A179FLF6_METCM|nr:hypothetical protein VFPPC_15953 [Pochonia chlamydosporia 170]OAQ65829.1 hypothetical protein VFPPC_15953 [Pochonia chlamydosporia 170]